LIWIMQVGREVVLLTVDSRKVQIGKTCGQRFEGGYDVPTIARCGFQHGKRAGHWEHSYQKCGQFLLYEIQFRAPFILKGTTLGD